jgi:hypothetical protein
MPRTSPSRIKAFVPSIRSYCEAPRSRERRPNQVSVLGFILGSARGAHPVRGKGRAHPQLLEQHEPSFSLSVRTPGAL